MIHPTDPRGRRRESTPAGCLLTDTHLPWHVCTYRHTDTYTHIVKCNRNYLWSKHTYAIAVTRASYKSIRTHIDVKQQLQQKLTFSTPRSPRSEQKCFQDNNRTLMFLDICSIYLIHFTMCPFYAERKPLSLSVTLAAQEGLTNCPHFSWWLVACTWPSWGHRCPVFLELFCDVTWPVA